ncbi:unnamed protein product [Soboliphyme baturini]|uniref:Endo/exonuclease/phosphatase domain-containing protein n=1 Tax=Soboliphyme baturini TaxID=241478 RepID=A0A183IM18_9BILA|nr:unnamed protein product [Soboliphyme baturini]
MVPSLKKCSPLSEVPNTEAHVLMGGFNADGGVDAEKWNGVIGKNGPSDLKNNMIMLQFPVNNGQSNMITFFDRRKVHLYTWYRKVCSQKSMNDLTILY